jgi:hypothetical protein
LFGTTLCIFRINTSEKEAAMAHQLGDMTGFDFNTGSGRIRVERTPTTLTPSGGLVAFAAFLEKLGIIEKLEATCPIQRTSNNVTPTRDILIGFILVCLQEGKRFRHMQWIQDDPAIAVIFKLKRRIPSDSSVIRFFNLSKHEEAQCSRKEFLFIPSSLTRSGRETILKMSVTDRLWDRIRDGYHRLLSWLHGTAPQLKLNGIGGRLTNAFLNSVEPLVPQIPASN